MNSPTPELDSTLQRFARQAQSLTLAGGAAIALASPEQSEGTDSSVEVMTCRASAGEDAPGVGARLRIGPSFAGECVREGRPLRCDDSEVDTRVDRERCRKLGIRSVVAVPLKNNGSVLGVIEIFSPRTKAFTESHMAKLNVLAERVTSAVEDAQNPSPPPQPAVLPEWIWADVFVDSSLPWKRMLQSAACHLLIVAAVWNISASWTRSERILRPTLARNPQLIYYPNSPSFPTAASHRPPEPAEAKVERQSGKTAAMVVKKAGGRETIAPPSVKLSARGDFNLPNGNPQMPALSRPAPVAAVTSPQRMNLASSSGPRMGQPSVVAPAPQVMGTGQRQGVAALNSLVVGPSPAVQGSIRSGTGVNLGRSPVVAPAPGLPLHDGPIGAGVPIGGREAVVGPPPSMPAREGSSILSAGLGGTGSVVGPPPGMPLHEGPPGSGLAMGGGDGVVAPPPAMPFGGRSVGSEASGRSSSGWGGSGTVVGPPPGIPEGGIGIASAGAGGLGSSVTALPPPGGGLAGTRFGQPGSPSGSGSEHGSGAGWGSGSTLGAGSGSGSGTGSESGSGSQTADASGSMTGAGTGAPKVIRSAVIPEPPRLDEPPGRIIPDLPVRVLGLALALPSSSFFSNYEVFIAERQIAKAEEQLIKLVFESRPTQRRVSEYGLKDSKIVKLKVKRDPTCDETAAQVTQNHLSEVLNASPDAAALRSTDADSILPCYRTTADDYQKTLSRR